MKALVHILARRQGVLASPSRSSSFEPPIPRRSKERPVHRLVKVSLVAVLFAIGAGAVASQALAAESHLEAHCSSGNVDETTESGGVSIPGYGSASAELLRLRAQASAFSENWDSVDACDVLTSFSNTIRIEPGSSGLSAGDPVTLTLTVELDGRTNANIHPPKGMANSGGDAVARVTVPDRPVCSIDDGREICKPAELARFLAGGRDFATGPTNEGNALVTHAWYWWLTGNRGDSRGDQETNTQECVYDPVLSCGAIGVPPPEQPEYRGTRTIVIDAFVGDRLELDGSLDVYADARNGFATHAVFDTPRSGLRLALAAGPGFEGLVLRYDPAPPSDNEPQPDTEAPTLTVPGGLTTNATSAAGAVVAYDVTATDNVPEGLEVHCSKPSGSAFPNGTTTVTCTATDAAANTTTKVFAVTVVDAAGQVLQLIDKTRQFLGLPALSPTLRQTLTGVFESVTAGRKTIACAGLRVYELGVRLMRSRELTSAERDELLADVRRIQSVIGCT